MHFLSQQIFDDTLTGVAGIGLRTDKPFYREYIQVKTIASLELDTSYILELDILAIYAYSISGLYLNRFEILLTENEVYAPLVNGYIPGRIDTTPSLVYSGSFLNDTTDWTTLSFSYKAKGGEQWLTIGMFSHDSVLDTQIVNDGYPGIYKWAYYLIDNVKLYKASDTIKKQPEPKIANVFSPNQDGVNEFFAIKNLPKNSTLEVFNRWGNLVFTQQPYQNNWPGNGPNGQSLAQGVYFAILSYQDRNGHLRQLKQTVHVVR